VGFAQEVIRLVSEHAAIDFRRAGNGFEAQGARDAAVYMSGALKTYAGSLIKIANDIRWLASGPRCGIGEINLPSLQPGSSIMPGKINPVIPESVIQAAVQVTGNDTTISVSGQMGVLELNTMMPVMAHNLLQSITLAANSSRILSEKCVTGITANREKCLSNVSSSLAMATCLVPQIGYDGASDLAKKAFSRGKTVKEIVLEESVMSEEDFDELAREFFGTGQPWIPSGI
ncbi:MAG: class II fumarate hydratase, partial [Desulfarculaceae bacterium]|nr:class II fumarate hydratase [Desulfarculaceae bacterium]